MEKTKIYSVGTLQYTFQRLLVVFFWMLWGSVAMTLLNALSRTTTPFLFRNNNLSDTFTLLLLGSVYSLMNTVMNPILSFNSDRCRSHWGRRIPFILFTAVPLGLASAAMPFYPHLAKLLPWSSIGPFSMLEILFFIGGMLYCFFWLFIGAIYYYLIPDVIPVEMMGRYYSSFRVAGIIAGVCFSKYVFQYSVSHPEIVYPAVSLFYTLSIIVMCLIIKEGQYPAIEAQSEVKPWYERLAAAVKTYAVECFSQRYYLCYYCVTLLFSISGCVAVFMNFFYTDACGMSVAEAGELNVYIGIGSFVACLLAGWVVDKCGAFRAAIVSLFFMSVLSALGGIFIHDFTSALIWRLPFCLPSGIYSVACGKMLVEIFPRSRFGSFASAQAMFGSLIIAFVNYPVGMLSDMVKNAGAETVCMIGGFDLMTLMRNYRFVNYWSALCYILSMSLLIFFYVHYQKNRHDKAFEL